MFIKSPKLRNSSVSRFSPYILRSSRVGDFFRGFFKANVTRSNEVSFYTQFKNESVFKQFIADSIEKISSTIISNTTFKDERVAQILNVEMNVNALQNADVDANISQSLLFRQIDKIDNSAVQNKMDEITNSIVNESKRLFEETTLKKLKENVTVNNEQNVLSSIIGKSNSVDENTKLKDIKEVSNLINDQLQIVQSKIKHDKFVNELVQKFTSIFSSHANTLININSGQNTTLKFSQKQLHNFSKEALTQTKLVQHLQAVLTTNSLFQYDISAHAKSTFDMDKFNLFSSSDEKLTEVFSQLKYVIIAGAVFIIAVVILRMRS